MSAGTPVAPALTRRPRTVTAAAAVTILASVVTGTGLVAVVVLMLTHRDRLLDQAGDNAAFDSFSPDQLVGIVVGVCLAMVVWCVAAVVLAVLVLRRSGVARILLVVSAAGTAAFSLVAILSLVSALSLVAALAVVVLLFTGGANAWFAGTPAGAPRRPPATAPLDSLTR
jgi:hypothetical protein